jgi:N-acetylmuramoyl-L-alanine amidase
MAKMQLRPSLLKIRRQSVKWIIIHHTAEMYLNPMARMDNPQYQMSAIFNGVLELKQGDVNYHYVVEKIKDDYVAIATRPFPYLCEWDDIPANINKRAIHIAALGNLDFQIPPLRLYQIMAYRLVNPMLKMFAIPPSKIKLHRDVSDDKDVYCPGEFFELDRLITQVRRYVIK